MNNPKHDDFRIHAFVDDQLDADDREEFMHDMEQDASLRDQVCQLRHLKSTLRHAYVDEDTEVRPRPWYKRVGVRHVLANGMAAGLVLMLGFVAGWAINQSETPLDNAISLDQAQTQTLKVILHIDDSDPAKFNQVLATADDLIGKYERAGVEVEVIANGGGLDHLRSDTSPRALEVKAMMEKHDNLHFVACTKAIQRLEKSGVQVMLIDRTHQAPSAVEHIVRRLQQGWQYIRV
jgi:intracellular sulfur oxidation DsrE/DsrF family protein